VVADDEVVGGEGYASRRCQRGHEVLAGRCRAWATCRAPKVVEGREGADSLVWFQSQDGQGAERIREWGGRRRCGSTKGSGGCC
jgi:hypothetical protein